MGEKNFFDGMIDPSIAWKEPDRTSPLSTPYDRKARELAQTAVHEAIASAGPDGGRVAPERTASPAELEAADDQAQRMTALRARLEESDKRLKKLSKKLAKAQRKAGK